jgi:hypothetical protein
VARQWQWAMPVTNRHSSRLGAITGCGLLSKPCAAFEPFVERRQDEAAAGRVCCLLNHNIHIQNTRERSICARGRSRLDRVGSVGYRESKRPARLLAAQGATGRSRSSRPVTTPWIAPASPPLHRSSPRSPRSLHHGPPGPRGAPGALDARGRGRIARWRRPLRRRVDARVAADRPNKPPTTPANRPEGSGRPGRRAPRAPRAARARAHSPLARRGGARGGLPRRPPRGDGGRHGRRCARRRARAVGSGSFYGGWQAAGGSRG